MPTTLLDTAGWQVVVPIKPALNLTGSHLTATLADRFGGAVVALDSATPLPAYGVNQIDWTPDPATGLTSSLTLTVTRAMRGDWLATGPNGLPGLVTLFADVQRTVAGSARDPEPLGRTSFSVMPGTDSPSVAAAGGGFQALLVPLQGLQAITGTALQVGPQGPAHAIPQIVAAAPLSAGQPIVVLVVPPGAQPASSASLQTSYVEGLAIAAAAAGYPVPVERDALSLPDWTAITGTAQLAIGRDYFLAPAGTLTLTPDSLPGHCTVRVGRAVSAATLMLDVSPPFLN